MSSHLVFNGRVLAHPQVLVTVTGADGERALVPPAGSQFDWGHMGSAVGTLAAAIAAELYPEDQREANASLIKRHFLTQIKRQDAWRLSGAEIESYIADRRAAAPKPAFAGSTA